MGCCNRNLQLDPSEKLSESPTADSTSLPEQISVWGCIHMTTSHKKGIETLYIYVWRKPATIWVWLAWGAAIIWYSMIQAWTEWTPPLIFFPLSQSRYQVGVASIWLPATIEGIETLYICMKKTCYHMSMTSVGCRNHMVQHDPSLNRVNTSTDFFTSLPEQNQCEVASIWLPATIEGIETLYICMMMTCFEYEVDGMPQS
jgi:hypothetical protein